jgi:hypothetical protein
MDWIFRAFVGAAVIHVIEEYGYPGGFLNWMRRSTPKFDSLITVRFAVIINGLFLLLCVIGAIVATRNLVFSLSVASLLFFNGLTHLAGAIRAKRYAPGVVSGVLLYMPLSFYAFYLFAGVGQLTLAGGAMAGLLGVLYQAVPIGYLGLSSMARRA